MIDDLSTEVTTDVPEEPVRGSMADINVLASPGLEQARAMLEGRLALPPNARLTGRRLVDVADGSVVFTMPLRMARRAEGHGAPGRPDRPR